MKARIKATDSLWFEAEEEFEDELFKQIARTQEVFYQPECGACASPKVKFICRLDTSGNDWLEVSCQVCRAKLVFGRTKKGGKIFPKIRWDQLSEKQQQQRANEKSYADKHKGYLPDKGWYVYKPLNKGD